MHRSALEVAWPKKLRTNKKSLLKNLLMNWARTEMVSQAPRHVIIESGVQPEELRGWRSTTGGASRRSLGREAPGAFPGTEQAAAWPELSILPNAYLESDTIYGPPIPGWQWVKTRKQGQQLDQLEDVRAAAKQYNDEARWCRRLAQKWMKMMKENQEFYF